jgi:hypothetical protein
VSDSGVRSLPEMHAEDAYMGLTHFRNALRTFCQNLF